MDEEVRKKITRARTQLILRKPFFGYLSLYLEPKERSDMLMPTMGTDGKNLYYDPEFVRSLDDRTLQGVIAHEVFHCGFGHVWRRGVREPTRWNIATDCAANIILADKEGFSLPSGAILNRDFAGMSAEEIYSKLSPPPKGKGRGSGKGEGGDQGEGVFDDHSEWGKKGGKEALGDGKGKENMEQKWREYASRARQVVKLQGSGMGSMDELVDELLEPKMPWQELLRNFVLSSVITDYQISPPNKRHIWRNIYLPSPKKADEVEIAFVTDTSGSMSTEEIRDALSELKGICEQFSSFRIWYVECDWDIQRILELTSYSYDLDEVKKIRGRGGTRFPVAHIMERIQNEEGGNPNVIVYFTDGYGSTEGVEPTCPVIWLVCQKGGFKPEFGTVIAYER